MTIPNEIFHYFSSTDRPFQNLSDLEPDKLSAVLAKLRERKAQRPEFKRVFGGAYMEFRRRTETKMRELFLAGGGKPERLSPHYFILGQCEWFAGLYPDPTTVKLDWRALPDEIASFTYPDSFIAMRFGSDYGLPPEPLQPYHDSVFRLSQLEDVVTKYGLPDGRAESTYNGYHKRKFEKYIEVQIWSDTPVAEHLNVRTP